MKAWPCTPDSFGGALCRTGGQAAGCLCIAGRLQKHVKKHMSKTIVFAMDFVM